jgi:Transposase IS116/IS110/IS902 family
MPAFRPRRRRANARRPPHARIRPGNPAPAIGTGDVFSKGRDFGAWLGLVPKQISTGDRTILGKISKRSNRYLRVLFVQPAWAVLLKPKSWERYGLKPWIEAAKKRLHHQGARPDHADRAIGARQRGDRVSFKPLDAAQIDKHRDSHSGSRAVILEVSILRRDYPLKRPCCRGRRERATRKQTSPFRCRGHFRDGFRYEPDRDRFDQTQREDHRCDGAISSRGSVQWRRQRLGRTRRQRRSGRCR